MLRLLAVVLCLTLPACAQPKLQAPALIALADANSPTLAEAIRATFTLKDLHDGTASVSRGPDFFFATESTTQPTLILDEATTVPTHPIPNTNLYYATAHNVATAQLHAFHYMIAGQSFGGRLDLPAFGPLSYLAPGVPSGTLSPKLTHISKLYDGMKSVYWIYVPAQYDPKIPAALMVFQDGGGYIDRNGQNPVLNTIDNLIATKQIPVMICLFINPGDIADSPNTPTYNFVQGFATKWSRTLKDAMRSTLYDTVSDRYPRFLREEVVPEVLAKYNIRKDSYSRAITGASSGGICSFNAAWQAPEDFSRVLSWIGSFTAIQWKENPANPDGGQDYPEKILREPHRNLRVWLQDGANDQENDRYGSWPLANIRMANALHLKGYDAHLSFGRGTHNYGQGAAEFPASMLWLWRDYNRTQTQQTYTLDPTEKAAPPYRVTITNR